MFLLVPAHPGFPGQIPQSRKTVVVVLLSHNGNGSVDNLLCSSVTSSRLMIMALLVLMCSDLILVHLDLRSL